MGLSTYPTPLTVVTTLNTSTFTIATSNSVYQGSVTLEPAAYTITCTSTTITTVEFYSDATTYIVTGVTASGTISVNIPSTVSIIRAWTNTGSNIAVTITKSSFPVALGAAFSGTIDTVTASTTSYTGTSTSGFAYAILVGGGGGGGIAFDGYGGGGGAAGAVVGKFVQLTGSMPITIGNGGAGGAGGAGANGGQGGDTTFGGATAYGGGGAPYGAQAGSYRGGLNGTIVASGGNGGNASSRDLGQTGSVGTVTGTIYPFITPVKTTGSGGGGWSTYSGFAGGTGTIGTGGSGGLSNGQTGSAGTGYGSGGGGAAGNVTFTAGGAGRPGVVYIFRY